jgi:PAS domain S-box-containing protein
MTLRRNILLFTGGMVLIMGLIASAFMFQLMGGAISEMEEAYVHQKVDSTLFYLQQDLSSLKMVGADWGPWDDTRDFVMGEGEDYVQNNLDNWTLSNLGTDFMIFYDGSSDLFYSRAFDPTTGDVVEAPDRLLNLGGDDLLLAHSSPEDSTTGIIADPEGVLLVSSHPITESQWQNPTSETPIFGTLIVGCHLDEARVAELGDLNGLTLSIEAISSTQEAINPASPDYQLVERKDEDTIIATEILEDVYGNPTILLEARIPRVIHLHGMVIIRHLAAAIGLASLFFGALILIFLNQSLLDPLAAITCSVEAIRRTEDPEEFRVPIAGSGELANLANSINEMLDRLESYDQKLMYSEEKFGAIFNTAQDCIFIKDQEGRYAKVNPAMEKIFEMTASEILGKMDDILFSPEMAAQIRDEDSVVLSGKVSVSEVIKDPVEGDLITFHVVKAPLRDERGKVVGICGIARDITERKRNEIELQNRDMLLAASAVASNALLMEEDIDSVMVDALQFLAEAMRADRAYVFENEIEDGEVVMSLRYEWADDGVEPQINNPPLQRHPYLPDFGRLYDTISRKKPYKGIVRDLPAPEKKILETEEVVSVLIVPIIVEERLWGFVGFDDCHSERDWSKNEIAVIQSAAGSIGGAIIRSRTGKYLLRARDELERRINEVEVKNAEMERFVYTVSHDLRSPLVTVQGFVGFLREDISEGDHERVEIDIRMIEEAVVKMEHLLKDTLELTRIGRVTSPPVDVSFGEIACEALDQFSLEIESRGINLVLAESWPVVRVDRLRTLEVLVNLIENSVKYMGDEAHPEIEIGWRRDGDETVFFVRDNGIGIEADQREKVFDLFYKLDPDSEGNGVGLAIVKRIIEVQGGRIWIDSDGDRGTSVSFTLPTVES